MGLLGSATMCRFSMTATGFNQPTSLSTPISTFLRIRDIGVELSLAVVIMVSQLQFIRWRDMNNARVRVWQIG